MRLMIGESHDPTRRVVAIRRHVSNVWVSQPPFGDFSKNPKNMIGLLHVITINDSERMIWGHP